MKNRVEKQALANKPNRFMELEGLRVIAAIIVVFYHAALIFYPGYFYGVGNSIFSPVQNIRFEDNLYQNPLAGLLSGTFAVGIFFVLSGFVLSIGYFKKRDPSIIIKMASKRYLRLMVPALASVLLAWVLIKIGGAALVQRAADVTHSGWLDQLWFFTPNFFVAFWQGTVAIFTATEVYYNPVLWTIHHELVGSFVVFGVALVFASSRYRWMVYVALIYALIHTWLLGFVLGMVLADLYVNRESFFKLLNSKLTYLLMLAGVVVAGFPSGPVTSSLYRSLLLPGFEGTQYLSFYTAIGATTIVAGAIALPELRKFLAHRWISGLGKYTYALYLVHMPLLFTVCTGVFLLALPVGFHKASLLAIIAAWAVIIPFTYLFERYIDAPAIRFASYCANLYMENKQPVFVGVLFRKARAMKRKLTRPKQPSPEVDMEVE